MLTLVAETKLLFGIQMMEIPSFFQIVFGWFHEMKKTTKNNHLDILNVHSLKAFWDFS